MCLPNLWFWENMCHCGTPAAELLVVIRVVAFILHQPSSSITSSIELFSKIFMVALLRLRELPLHCHEIDH